MNVREADGLIGRWFQLLSEFHFVVQHRKGSKYGNADSLSRASPRKCSRNDCPECYPSLDGQCNVILASLNSLLSEDCSSGLLGVLSCEKLDSGDISVSSCNVEAPMGWTIDDLVRYQCRDDDITALIAMKKAFDKERPPATSILSASKDVKFF